MPLSASLATRILAGIAACALLAGMRPAAAADIAVAAPLTGPFAELGTQVRDAVRRSFPTEGAIESYDTACTMEGGKAAAEQAVAAGTRLIIGFLCTESLQGAVPILSGKGIAVLSLGIRTRSVDTLTERNKVPFFRLAPAATAEAEAAGRLIAPLWREKNFAILDDGTIGSRDLAEALRSAAQAKGLKPVFVDTFRPQLENQVSLILRLAKAGATHVFAAGDRADVAVMAQDAANRETGMVFAGGEALEAADDAVPLPDGVIMAGLGDWADFSDATRAIARELAAAGTDPSRYFWRALAAGEIAADLMKNAPSGNPGERLATGTFQTTLGPVSFDAGKSWTAEIYGLYVQKEGRFVPLPPGGEASQ